MSDMCRRNVVAQEGAAASWTTGRRVLRKQVQKKNDGQRKADSHHAKNIATSCHTDRRYKSTNDDGREQESSPSF